MVLHTPSSNSLAAASAHSYIKPHACPALPFAPGCEQSCSSCPRLRACGPPYKTAQLHVLAGMWHGGTWLGTGARFQAALCASVRARADALSAHSTLHAEPIVIKPLPTCAAAAAAGAAGAGPAPAGGWVAAAGRCAPSSSSLMATQHTLARTHMHPACCAASPNTHTTSCDSYACMHACVAAASPHATPQATCVSSAAPYIWM